VLLEAAAEEGLDTVLIQQEALGAEVGAVSTQRLGTPAQRTQAEALEEALRPRLRLVEVVS
jgi:hypothetical protein